MPIRLNDLVAAFQARSGTASRQEAERSLVHLADELGGCLTWREAHNLADMLSEPVAGHLRRGAYESAMARFSPRSFVARLAEREGVGVEEARRRAVIFFALLRDRLPSGRWQPIAEELDRYGALIARAR